MSLFLNQIKFWCTFLFLLMLLLFSFNHVEAESEGIDVSSHQEDINYSKVEKAGKSFIIARATKGNNFVDPNFTKNIKNANAEGLKTNAYHFFKATSKSEAKDEADRFIKQLKKADVKGSVFVDVEDPDLTDNAKDLTGYINAFLDRIEDAGYEDIGIYVSKNYMDDRLVESDLKDNIIKWIARWSDDLGRSADVWQYSSEGKVAGVSGDVDLNVAYTSRVGQGESDTTYQYYTVQRGDTLSEIAVTYNTTVNTLKQFNNIHDADKIDANQKIKVGKYYVVKKGDTLSEIAEEHHTTVAQLQAFNNIKTPDKIQYGQNIRIK